jgi:hypothetical protein
MMKQYYIRLLRTLTLFWARVSNQFLLNIRDFRAFIHDVKSQEHMGFRVILSMCLKGISILFFILLGILLILLNTFFLLLSFGLRVIVAFIINPIALLIYSILPSSIKTKLLQLSTHVFGYPAPILKTSADIVPLLRKEVNRKLKTLDRGISIITTPVKEAGLARGWDEYDLWIVAQGTIEQMAKSSDGLKTIDIRLHSLKVFDKKFDLFDKSKQPSVYTFEDMRYIRSEVYPQVRMQYSGKPLKPTDTIQLFGQLKWDKDGFFEIHPMNGVDLNIIPKTIPQLNVNN